MDIKHCPSCNHDVYESHKKVSLQEHKCSLCRESIVDENHDIDKEVYNGKIETWNLTNKEIEKELKRLDIQGRELQESYNSMYADIVSLEQNR